MTSSEQIYKILIFSSLTTINIIIWYEILGMKLLITIALIVAVINLIPWKKQS